MTPGPTRRELMLHGLSAGGMLAATVVAPDSAAAAAPAEARALTHALQIEQLVVISYRQVLGSAVLKPPVRAQLRVLLGHELQHVTLLQHALEARGEIVPRSPTVTEAQATLIRHQVHWSLTQLPNQHDCLKLLVDVESLAENAYFHALEQLQDLALVRLSTQVMACEAQHWTVLAGLLNHLDPKKAVPYPFVEGSP